MGGFSCASAAAAAVRKTSCIPCFLHLSTGFCGAGTGAGDAFFGLICFRRRTQAPDASRRTCAQARLGECVQRCSLLCVWVRSERVLGVVRRSKQGPAFLEFFLVLPISPVRPASAAGDGEALGYLNYRLRINIHFLLGVS